MNKLLATLIAGVFAVSSAVAVAQPTTTPKADAMKSTSDKDKYKDCMKKDAAGKMAMDQACKDKMDKGSMDKGSMDKGSMGKGSMGKGDDAMKGGDAMKGSVPTGSDGKAAPKGK